MTGLVNPALWWGFHEHPESARRRRRTTAGRVPLPTAQRRAGRCDGLWTRPPLDLQRYSTLPLDPGELFQHRAECGGVLAAAALRDARIVVLHCRGEERCGAMEVGGEFADDGEVL